MDKKTTPRTKRINHTETTNGTQECKNKRQALAQVRKLLIEKKINFRTDNQGKLNELIDTHDITIISGPAGSGETYVTVYNALQTIASKDNRIDGCCRRKNP